jgi:drug/metabolite transporter (DMT)-like permease
MAFAAGVFPRLDMWLWQTAIGHIGTGLATLIANSQVVIVPLVAWALLSERPSRTFVSMPVVMVGLVLITGLGGFDAFGSDPVLGVVLAAFAPPSSTRLPDALPPGEHQPRSGHRVLATWWRARPLARWLAGLASGDLDFVPVMARHGWLLVLALGSQVFGWMLIGYALPRLPAAHTSFAILLQPSLTLVWGAIIFTERPSLVQWLGVAIVLAGIAAVTLPGRRTASAVP